MGTSGSPGRSRPIWAAAAGSWLLAALLLAGCGGAQVVGEAPRGSTAQPNVAVDPVLRDRSAARPVRIRVPAIGVDAPIRPLAVGRGGVLQAPTANDVAGWWRAGPEPGESGPSVIAGHVDSHRGPAVFYRVPELRAGVEVLVDRADGSTAVFTTYEIERHPKDAFPTRAVYGPTPGAELRLITCGGEFDDEGGRYLANVIAFAKRTG
ncbi:class F sortase [Saccharopolyspora griseoalba]|uniref:Class F sortase n=1 Tax=Saccharopolyspora griseoalba TaxID=1431848 RepID=A0ABW2LHK8_9PSEU